jgi:ADP-ribose pyrophosphatase YjhB (NUDIX family)
MDTNWATDYINKRISQRNTRDNNEPRPETKSSIANAGTANPQSFLTSTTTVHHPSQSSSSFSSFSSSTYDGPRPSDHARSLVSSAGSESAPKVSYKSMLNLIVQANKLQHPRFQVASVEGPAHAPLITVVCQVAVDDTTQQFAGYGNSKKEAENEAAYQAYLWINRASNGRFALRANAAAALIELDRSADMATFYSEQQPKLGDTAAMVLDSPLLRPLHTGLTTDPRTIPATPHLKTMWGAAIVIVVNGTHFMLISEHRGKGLSLLGGGGRKTETARECVHRECMEEIGFNFDLRGEPNVSSGVDVDTLYSCHYWVLSMPRLPTMKLDKYATVTLVPIAGLMENPLVVHYVKRVVNDAFSKGLFNDCIPEIVKTEYVRNLLRECVESHPGPSDPSRRYGSITRDMILSSDSFATHDPNQLYRPSDGDINVGQVVVLRGNWSPGVITVDTFDLRSWAIMCAVMSSNDVNDMMRDDDKLLLVRAGVEQNPGPAWRKVADKLGSKNKYSDRAEALLISVPNLLSSTVGEALVQTVLHLIRSDNGFYVIADAIESVVEAYPDASAKLLRSGWSPTDPADVTLEKVNDAKKGQKSTAVQGAKSTRAQNGSREEKAHRALNDASSRKAEVLMREKDPGYAYWEWAMNSMNDEQFKIAVAEQIVDRHKDLSDPARVWLSSQHANPLLRVAKLAPLLLNTSVSGQKRMHDFWSSVGHPDTLPQVSPIDLIPSVQTDEVVNAAPPPSPVPLGAPTATVVINDKASVIPVSFAPEVSDTHIRSIFGAVFKKLAGNPNPFKVDLTVDGDVAKNPGPDIAPTVPGVQLVQRVAATTPNPTAFLGSEAGKTAQNVLSLAGSKSTDPVLNFLSHSPLGDIASRASEAATDIGKLVAHPNPHNVLDVVKDAAMFTPAGGVYSMAREGVEAALGKLGYTVPGIVDKLREHLPANVIDTIFGSKTSETIQPDKTAASLHFTPVAAQTSPHDDFLSNKHDSKTSLPSSEIRRMLLSDDPIDRAAAFAVLTKDLESTPEVKLIGDAAKFVGFENTGPGLTGGETDFKGITAPKLAELLRKIPSDRTERITQKHDLAYLAARTIKDLDDADDVAIDELQYGGPTARAAARLLAANKLKRSITGKSPNLTRDSYKRDLAREGVEENPGPKITPAIVKALHEAANKINSKANVFNGTWYADLMASIRQSIINTTGLCDAPLPVYGFHEISIPNAAWAAMVNNLGIANSPERQRLLTMTPNKEMRPATYQSEMSYTGDMITMTARFAALIASVDSELTGFTRIRADNILVHLGNEAAVANSAAGTMTSLRFCNVAPLVRGFLLAMCRMPGAATDGNFLTGNNLRCNFDVYANGPLVPRLQGANRMYWPYSEAQLAQPAAPAVHAMWCSAEELASFLSGSSDLSWNWPGGVSPLELGKTIAVVPINDRGNTADNAIRPLMHLQHPFTAMCCPSEYYLLRANGWADRLDANQPDETNAAASGTPFYAEGVVLGPKLRVLYVVSDLPDRNVPAGGGNVRLRIGLVNVQTLVDNNNVFINGAATVDIAPSLEAVWTNPTYTCFAITECVNRYASTYCTQAAYDCAVDNVLPLYSYRMRPLAMLHVDNGADVTHDFLWSTPAPAERPPYAVVYSEAAYNASLNQTGEFLPVGLWTDGVGDAGGKTEWEIQEAPPSALIMLAMQLAVYTTPKARNFVAIGDGLLQRICLRALAYAASADMRAEGLSKTLFYTQPLSAASDYGSAERKDNVLAALQILSEGCSTVAIQPNVNRSQFESWNPPINMNRADAPWSALAFVPYQSAAYAGEGDEFVPSAARGVQLDIDECKSLPSKKAIQARPNGTIEFVYMNDDALKNVFPTGFERLQFVRPTQLVAAGVELGFCTKGGNQIAGVFVAFAIVNRAAFAMRWMVTALTNQPTGLQLTEDMMAGSWLPAIVENVLTNEINMLSMFVGLNERDIFLTFRPNTLTYQTTAAYATSNSFNAPLNVYNSLIAKTFAKRSLEYGAAGSDSEDKFAATQSSLPMQSQQVASEAVALDQK